MRAAVRGTAEDLTTVAIRRAVVLLAVPTVLEMAMESLLTIVDIFVVAKLGFTAVAAVGLTESMLSPIYALAMGLAAGATAVIARRTGEKDHEGAAVAAVQVIVVSVVVALIVGVAGAFFAHELLELMGATPDVQAEGHRYAAVMFGGSVTIFLLFVINAVVRAAGDAAMAMRALWLANGINIVLAPCLVFGLGPLPEMGVLGAAVATTLGRAVGVVYQAVVLARRGGRMTITRRHLHLELPLMKEILRIASPASLQILIETASWLGLVRLLSTFGSVALAGYTIAMRISTFALLPPWGLAAAAATLVGQNLGARKTERAEKSVTTIARYNLIFFAGLSVAFIAAPGAIVSPFTEDAAVASVAIDCLRIVALGFLAFAYGMVAIQAYNGAGDTLTPALVNAGSFWALKIPLAWLLAHYAGLGPNGVFVAITVAYVVQSGVAVYLFRRGSWRKVRAL